MEFSISNFWERISNGGSHHFQSYPEKKHNRILNQSIFGGLFNLFFYIAITTYIYCYSYYFEKDFEIYRFYYIPYGLLEGGLLVIFLFCIIFKNITGKMMFIKAFFVLAYCNIHFNSRNISGKPKWSTIC